MSDENWRAIAEANEADYWRAKRERDEARAEIERLRRGEVDGVFTSVVHECCERVEKAEAAIAEARSLCTAAVEVWDEQPEAWQSGAVPEPIVPVADLLDILGGGA